MVVCDDFPLEIEISFVSGQKILTWNWCCCSFCHWKWEIWMSMSFSDDLFSGTYHKYTYPPELELVVLWLLQLEQGTDVQINMRSWILYERSLVHRQHVSPPRLSSPPRPFPLSSLSVSPSLPRHNPYLHKIHMSPCIVFSSPWSTSLLPRNSLFLSFSSTPWAWTYPRMVDCRNL